MFTFLHLMPPRFYGKITDNSVRWRSAWRLVSAQRSIRSERMAALRVPEGQYTQTVYGLVSLCSPSVCLIYLRPISGASLASLQDVDTCVQASVDSQGQHFVCLSNILFFCLLLMCTMMGWSSCALCVQIKEQRYSDVVQLLNMELQSHPKVA